MNELKVRHCLLAIASLNLNLMQASDGNLVLDCISDEISDLLQICGMELEQVANEYPVRVMTLATGDEDTRELVPVTADERAGAQS